MSNRSLIWLGYEFGLGLILSFLTCFGLLRLSSKVVLYVYDKWFASVGVSI